MSAIMMVLMTDEEVAVIGRNHVRGDSGFGALRTARGLLPLVAMEVDARVAGVIASVELAQTFVNTTGAPIEATYIFPLPDRAAVHRFRMEVAGRVVEGVVEERGAAREQYDEAISRGHRAAITEEERPGVFTLRAGNLMPGEAATVRLSMVGPLPVDDGEVTFRFPLVVAPRYMPGAGLGGDQAGLGVAGDTHLVPDASRISPPVLLPGCPNPVRLGLRVALADHGVREVASSLHAITTANRDAHVVEVHPGERLDRDFILRWRVDGAALRSQLVCADDADGRAGTFMLTLVPPSTSAVAAKPRDVVFVIDRSGSMGGWKMVAARRAAARMIDTLTSRDRFCAIAFDDSVELLPEGGLVDATDRNRFRAVEALARVDARGGTEMAAPLRDAVGMLAGGHQDRERVVVLVTDGQVGNEDHILRELGATMRNVRMFALGIDQAVNAAFLRRLAGMGGGMCELVESEDRLDAVMDKVHRRIGTPIATELALRGVELDLDTMLIAPKKLPDVYAGAPVTILGRYRGTAPGNAAISVDGLSLGEALRMSVRRDAEPPGAATWLAASWARAAIRDREDQYAAGARGGLEHEIINLSKKFGVLSRFTAFLAVDRAAVVNPGGRLAQVVQPVEQPAGWTGAATTKAPVSARGRSVSLGRAGGMAPPPPSAPRPMSMPLPTKAPAAAFDVDDEHVERAGGVMFSELEEEASTEQRAYAAPKDAPAMPAQLSSRDRSRAKKEVRAEEEKLKLKPSESPIEGEGMLSLDDAAADLSVAPGGPPEPEPARKVSAPATPPRTDLPYHVKLGAIARDLDAIGRGTLDAMQLRILRGRLTEWVEDVRSVGGHAALADAVEELANRLAAALAGTAPLDTEVIAIAGELAALAAGAPPPAPKKHSRAAFWK